MTAADGSVAWLYLRLSADGEGANDSLANQQRILRERADSEGLRVETVYCEGAGRSAYGGAHRPEWERLLRDLRPGVVVMAVETSRFSRATEDGLRELRRIRSAGAHVVTTRPPRVDTRTTPEGPDLPRTILLAVAEHESAEKGRRVRDRKAGQRLHGIWLGVAPYGHRINTSHHLELDPGTAPLMRHIVDLALTGQSGATIAHQLNAEQLPSPRQQPWSATTVLRLIKNPAMVGWTPASERLPSGGRSPIDVCYGPDGQPVRCVDGPTIMTEAERGLLLDFIAKRSTRDRTGIRRGTHHHHVNALMGGGIMRCGRCGGPMYSSSNYYVCDTRRRNLGCAGVIISKNAVEPELLYRLHVISNGSTLTTPTT